jgi:hypothetical protein
MVRGRAAAGGAAAHKGRRAKTLQKTICSTIVFWYPDIALVRNQPRENYGYR